MYVDAVFRWPRCRGSNDDAGARMPGAGKNIALSMFHARHGIPNMVSHNLGFSRVGYGGETGKAVFEKTWN